MTAARVMQPPPPGLTALMKQAWERFGLPLAVTESHLGCTREEQMRWLWQSWQSCVALQEDGVDVRAFTAWALLGNVDWNSLITVDANHYEPGAFDLRGGSPRKTAVGRLIKTLGSPVERNFETFPAIASEGWWQRDIRLEHAPHVWAEEVSNRRSLGSERPILITGGTGTLGQALARDCVLRGLPHILTDRAKMPIDEPSRVGLLLDRYRPWAVINAAGWVRVDDAEAEAEACFRANSDGAAILAAACAARGIHCTIFSSDLVFDGRGGQPYLEGDAPNPLNIYGESKLRAEAMTGLYPETLAIRTAAFFSPHDQHNFAVAVERVVGTGQDFLACPNSIVSPTFVPDLVSATLDLVVDRECGIWHLANDGAVSWMEFGRLIADACKLDPRQVRDGTPDQLGWRAKRPQYAALGSERGGTLPSLESAVSRFAEARRAAS